MLYHHFFGTIPKPIAAAQEIIHVRVVHNCHPANDRVTVIEKALHSCCKLKKNIDVDKIINLVSDLHFDLLNVTSQLHILSAFVCDVASL
jgi:hypothetical protein